MFVLKTVKREHRRRIVNTGHVRRPAERVYFGPYPNIRCRRPESARLPTGQIFTARTVCGRAATRYRKRIFPYRKRDRRTVTMAR